MEDIVTQPWFVWAVIIVLGLPLLIIILGEMLIRLHRRQSAFAYPVSIVRHFLLPVTAVWLLLTGVIGLATNQPLVQGVATLFWLFAISAILSFFNVSLFVQASESSWRAKVPRLFIDLARVLLIIVGLAIVLSTVWGADVSALFTALGVSSIVLGLTLQNSVGSLISGLLLLSERPFTTGDWLKVGDIIGKVVQINWRAVHLDAGNEILVVPNGTLANTIFQNFSRPTPHYIESVELRFKPTDPPNTIKQMLRDLVVAMPYVLNDSPPLVTTTANSSSAIVYTTELVVARYEDVAIARDEFLTRVWYAAQRHQLSLEGIETLISGEPSLVQQGLKQVADSLRIDAEHVASVAERARVLPYARNELIMERGQPSRGLYVVLSGRVRLTVGDPVSGTIVIDTLESGHYFGESVATNEPSAFDARVVEDADVLLINQDDIRTLVDSHPRFADDLGEAIDLRQRTLLKLRSEPFPQQVPSGNIFI